MAETNSFGSKRAEPETNSFGSARADAIPEDVKRSLGVKSGIDAPQAFMQVATGALAEPIAGLAGLFQAINPMAEKGAGAETVRAVQEAMTYQPHEQSRYLLPEAVQAVIDKTPEIIRRPIAKGAEKYSQLEDWTLENYGAEAATALTTLPTALLEAIPAGIALRKARKLEGVEAIDDIAEETIGATIEEQAPEMSDFERVTGNLRKKRITALAGDVDVDVGVLEAAEELGIDLNPDHYSNNRAFIEVMQGLKSEPGSRIGMVEDKAIIKLGQRADELIEDMGGSVDRSLLDAQLQSDFKDTIADLTEQSDLLYKQLDEGIPADTLMQITSSQSYIDNLLADLGGDINSLNASEKRVYNLLQGDNTTYASLSRLRRDVGNALGRKSDVFKSDDAGQLKRLYGVLAEDQVRAADAFNLGDEYRAANELVSRRKSIEDEAVALFGREVQGSIIPKLAQASTALTKGDVSRFRSLMESVPEARRQEVAATMLNNLFSHGARSGAPIGQGFRAAYRGLNTNKGAKDELFKYLPEDAAQRFNNIGKVVDGLFSAKSFENASRTAPVTAILQAFNNGSAIDKLYDTGKKVSLGAAAGTVGGAPGMMAAGALGGILAKGKTAASVAADELLTSPAFREAVENVISGAPDILQGNKKYQTWLNLQSPDVKKEIIAIGLIPYLTAEQE